MRTTRQFVVRWFFGLLMVLGWVEPALATAPKTPITVELTLSQAPSLFEQTLAVITVESIFDAPDTLVELIPATKSGLIPSQTWTVDLTANVPVTFSAPVTFEQIGNVSILAQARREAEGGEVWGDVKEIPLTVGLVGAGSKFGWTVDSIPVAALSEPGDTEPISMAPTPLPYDGNVPPVSETPPSVDPANAGGGSQGAPNTPGNTRLTGRWQYADRSVVLRDIDQQEIEIRRGDGSALNPRAFCFTNTDGTFNCPFTHPGGSLRVWVWSYTSFNRPGGTDRLAVFAQNGDIFTGCGEGHAFSSGDNLDCAYSVQTGVVNCPAGSTCAIGTWTVDYATTGEPFVGAHQMSQDLIRSWKKLFFDPRHVSTATSGPGRIAYPQPTGHGTHAHVPPADGWISIEPPSQRSGDPVNHEYGHVVMANRWAGFSPGWPTSDCPSPHFIQRVSGPGCALSEGWANFWTWYSNEFYDGTNVPSHYGPVYDFTVGGAFTNMKTRDGGTYDAGDRVEGNIAATLGDFMDAFRGYPSGPTGGPFADNLADGIQHVWHTTTQRGYNNFAGWWNAYWNIDGHDRCKAYGALRFNSIDYAQLCPDLIVTGISTNPVSPVAGQLVTVTVTVRNQGNGSATGFWIDWYSDRATAPPLLVDGDRFCRVSLVLGPGATTTCVVTWTYPTAGTKRMWAQVDNRDEVSETSEVNNVFGPQNIVVQQPFNYALSNNGNITVVQGSSGSNTITATLLSGATQSVSFGTSALPAGASASFSPLPASCNPTCSKTLTIMTSASTPPGTYPITVTGTPLSRTTTFNLVVSPAFNYALSNNGNITVVQGSSGSNTITATLLSGATQTVSFGTGALPAGASAAFSPLPASCSPTCSKTLTITTSASTPPGTYPITVTGTPLSRTTTFNLVVNAAFDYALANSGDITVAQGSSGSNTITATLVAGATQSVSFNASGLPAGASPSFAPGSCSPTCSSMLTITTSASTPPGTYPVTVTGTPLSRTTTFNLVVNASFDYALANSGDITVARGSSGSNTITATLVAGAAQSVSFNASGLPVGASPSFAPGSCSPTCSSMLTITTSASTPTGTFPITVTGTPLSRTTGFNLVVTPQQFALAVTKAGSGTGSVTSSPGGIDCGATCSASFDQGTTVNLTPAGDVGSDFAGWTGGGCFGTGVCTVTVDGDVTVTAYFNLAAQPPVSFAPATYFGAGVAPGSVAVGDFNGDTVPDLAVANQNSNDVSVLLGDGTGSFGSPTNFAAGTTPIAIAVGDFNGDGFLDLAVANYTDNNVSVLLGDGSGGFGAPTNFTVGSQPLSVAVGDFNGDGFLDLAVANSGSNDVSVLLGDGTGNFGDAPSSPFGVGIAPVSLAVGDFNGDTFADLAVANSGSDDVSILLGDGTGSFGGATNFAVGTGPLSVAVEDFNGDTVPDLVVANNGSNDVSLLLGDGSGGFADSAGSPFAAGSGPTAVGVGDFNGDTLLDVAVVNGTSQNVSLLLGDGTGSLGSAISNFPVGIGPASIAVADLDGDLKPDMAVANSGSDNVSVLLNTTP